MLTDEEIVELPRLEPSVFLSWYESGAGSSVSIATWTNCARIQTSGVLLDREIRRESYRLQFTIESLVVLNHAREHITQILGLVPR